MLLKVLRVWHKECRCWDQSQCRLAVFEWEVLHRAGNSMVEAAASWLGTLEIHAVLVQRNDQTIQPVPVDEVEKQTTLMG